MSTEYTIRSIREDDERREHARAQAECDAVYQLGYEKGANAARIEYARGLKAGRLEALHDVLREGPRATGCGNAA